MQMKLKLLKSIMRDATNESLKCTSIVFTRIRKSLAFIRIKDYLNLNFAIMKKINTRWMFVYLDHSYVGLLVLFFLLRIVHLMNVKIHT